MKPTDKWFGELGFRAWFEESKKVYTDTIRDLVKAVDEEHKRFYEQIKNEINASR